jgi:hypothetical protein
MYRSSGARPNEQSGCRRYSLRYHTVLAAVETAWLFIKGAQSIRIVRAATLDGDVHLHIHGPGTTRESHTFHDVIDCMQYQADYERRIVAQGFVLERFTSDRRSAERRERNSRSRR